MGGINDLSCVAPFDNTSSMKIDNKLHDESEKDITITLSKI